MKVGVIGCGKMVNALIRGAVQKGALSPTDLFLYSRTLASAETLADAVGGKAVASMMEACEEVDVVLIGVKPAQMSEILGQLDSLALSSKLVVSVAAGVDLARLMKGGSQHRYARVMPNTPCLVGEGASAFCLSNNQEEGDSNVLLHFLQSVGYACEVLETQMDAVTGLSGSGPAYIFNLIEALSDGGVKNGLPRELATKLASQTVLGAAKMQLTTDEHPGILKDQVTSPGGTTITGLSVLENSGFRGAIISAVTSATEKSRSL